MTKSIIWKISYGTHGCSDTRYAAIVADTFSQAAHMAAVIVRESPGPLEMELFSVKWMWEAHVFEGEKEPAHKIFIDGEQVNR